MNMAILAQRDWPRMLAAAELFEDSPQVQMLVVMVYGFLLTVLAALLIRETRRTAQRNRERDAAILADRILQRLRSVTGDVALGLDQYTSQIDAASREMSLASAAESPEVQQKVLAMLQQMVAANQRLQERLQLAEFEIAVQRDQVEKHASEARTDLLTSLPNRRAFEEACQRSLALWRRYEHRFSVALIDVDRFKQFNDTYGHSAGDSVLREVGECLSMARSGDFACRYGGEEFALLLSNVALPSALCPADRSRRMIGLRTVIIDGLPQQVTVSVGVATALPEEELENLLHRADQALYAAKQAGRNCTWYHDGSQCQPMDPDADAGGSARLTLGNCPVAHQPASPPSPLAADPDISSGIADLEDVCRELRRQCESNLSKSSPPGLSVPGLPITVPR